MHVEVGQDISPKVRSTWCSYPGGFAGRGLIWLISGGDMPGHPEGPRGPSVALLH
jgi:hypothetical protein